MKEEKEFRCRYCQKILKESEIIRKIGKNHNRELICSYCNWVHVFPLEQVDWVSKIMGNKIDWTKDEKILSIKLRR